MRCTDPDVANLAGKDIKGCEYQWVFCQGSSFLLDGKAVGRVNGTGVGTGNFKADGQVFLEKIEDKLSQGFDIVGLFEHGAVGTVVKMDNQCILFSFHRGGNP